MTEPDDRTAARRAGDPETWDAEVLTNLMDTPQGRYFMERLLDFCGVGGSAYHWDGDALAAMKRDGMADVGRHLEQMLQIHCPDRYLQMIRERRARALRAIKKQEREEQRRDGQPFEHSGVTMVDELAEKQRLEAEAAAVKSKSKNTKNGDKPAS